MIYFPGLYIIIFPLCPLATIAPRVEECYLLWYYLEARLERGLFRGKEGELRSFQNLVFLAMDVAWVLSPSLTSSRFLHELLTHFLEYFFQGF